MKHLENTTAQDETRIPKGSSCGMLDLPFWGKVERRSGVERRQFSYAIHVPERRSGKDRRKPTTR